MTEKKSEYPPLPPDDLRRTLKLAAPEKEDGKLPHIGLVGDTYTITVSGDDTNDRFCVIDMHVPPGGGPGGAGELRSAPARSHNGGHGTNGGERFARHGIARSEPR